MTNKLTNLLSQALRRLLYAMILVIVVSAFGATAAFAKCDLTKNPNGCPVNDGQTNNIGDVDSGGVSAGLTGQELASSGTITITLPNGNTSSGNAFGLVAKTLTGDNATTSDNVTTGETTSGAVITLTLNDPLVDPIADDTVSSIPSVYVESGVTITSNDSGTTQQDLLNGAAVGPTGKPTYCTSDVVNEPIDDFQVFVKLARDWSRAWDANGDGLVPNGGWAHYIIPVYELGKKGWSITFVETSNSDNELVKMRGGWPNKSEDLWHAYNANQIHFPDQVICP